MPLNISELIATTTHKRRKEIANAVVGHNAVFYMLDRKKKIVTGDFSGSSCLEPITFSALNKTDDGTLHDAGFYKNYAQFDPTLGVETLTASEWEGCELGAVINTSNRESWMNQGGERALDWAEAKVLNMESELQELISNSTYSNGSAWGGNEFDGLGSILSLTPAIGTTGGIDRAANVWWRNKYYGWDSTAESITAAMDKVDLDTMRGSESCDLIVLGKDLFLKYQTETQALKRIVDAKIGDAGFKALEYNGTPVIYDAACPVDTGYFINTKYLKFRHPKGWWFKTEKAQQVPGATYKFTPCYVAGNFTCSDLARHAVIKKIL